MTRVVLLLALLLPAAARAQDRPPPSLGELSRESAAAPAGVLAPTWQERPPLTGARVAGQITTGVLGGAVGAAALAGGLYLASDDDADEWAGLAAIGIGALFGYPLGAAGGVYLIGNTGGQTGSPWATLAGSAAGALAGALLASPTEGLSYVVLVPVGATAGFNLTRHYRGSAGSR